MGRRLGKPSGRIKEGFETIAKEMEEQGAMPVVSHGMTIGTIVSITGMHPHGLDNGSVTILNMRTVSLA